MAKQNEILSANETATLQDEMKELESTINSIEKEGYGAGNRQSSVDINALKRQKDILQQKIDQGSAKRITGVSKDKLAAEAKDLEAKIKDGMPSEDEMWKPQKHPGSIRKNYEWEKRNIHNIMRYKQIQRQLNPGDPTCGNIEKLRKR